MLNFKFESAMYSERSKIQTITLVENVSEPCVFKTKKVWTTSSFCPYTCANAPTKYKVNYVSNEEMEKLINTEYNVSVELFNYIINNCHDISSIVTNQGEALRKVANKIISAEYSKTEKAIRDNTPIRMGMFPIKNHYEKNLIAVVDLERKRVIDLLLTEPNEGEIELRLLQDFFTTLKMRDAEKFKQVKILFVENEMMETLLSRTIANKNQLCRYEYKNRGGCARIDKFVDSMESIKQQIICRYTAQTASLLKRFLLLKQF